MSRASRWNRLHPLSLWAISGLISFRALFLSRWRLSTSQTSPMPPSPIFSRSRYLPKRSRPFAIMGGGAMFHPSDFSLAGCGEPSSDSPLSWLSPDEVGVKNGGVKPSVLCSLSWLSPDEVGVKNGGVKPRVLSLIFELSRDEDPRSDPSQVSRSRSPRRSCGRGCMCGRPKLGDTDRAGNR